MFTEVQHHRVHERRGVTECGKSNSDIEDVEHYIPMLAEQAADPELIPDSEKQEDEMIMVYMGKAFERAHDAAELDQDLHFDRKAGSEMVRGFLAGSSRVPRGFLMGSGRGYLGWVLGVQD